MRIQRTERDDCIVLTLSGSIDTTTAASVQHALLQALAEQPDAVICDLSGVTALDPVCATVLAAVASHPLASRRPDTRILLCGAQPAVAAVVRRLGTQRRGTQPFPPLYDSVDQAHAHARTRPPMPPEWHRLAPTTQARAAARRLLVEIGSRWELPDHLVHQAQRIAGELVAEAASNAPTSIVLRVELHGGELFLAVHDDRSPLLRPTQADLREPDWALRTVSEAAAAWGVDWRPEGGKVVWCILTIST